MPMPQNAFFARTLNAWYRRRARALPWRETADPYKIWISEIMLQQTTVNAVIPYYYKWMSVFPTVRYVAGARLQKILRLWQGLGYYSRARNIHRCAKVICQEYDGKIPDDAKHLSMLPGFGPYTVAAVLSIAFDKRYPVIDANVRRVMMRIMALRGVADTGHDQAIADFLDKVMPKRNLRTFNQALMELGALVCRNRAPLCLICPLKGCCLAYQKGIQEVIPVPKKRVVKDIDAVIAIIRKNGKFLIQKRPAGGLLADLWEFPGGKVKENESLDFALSREIKEELGIELRRSRHIMNVRHYYTQFRVNLHVSLCEPITYPAAHRNRKWVTLKGLHHYPMPSGSVKIVDHLVSLQTKP